MEKKRLSWFVGACVIGLAACGSTAQPASAPVSKPPTASGLAASVSSSTGGTVAASASGQPATTASAAKAAVPEVLDLKVGSLPIAPLTPLYVAAQKGFFKDVGFKSVELVPLDSGAGAIPVVESGKINLAQTTYVSGAQAREQGFNLLFASNLDGATDGKLVDGRRDVGALVVKNDSPIKELKDLEGKKVGVSSVPGILWMFTAEDIREHGGDYKKVSFQEVPFPQMFDAVDHGSIDAGAVLEPFTTVALTSGKVRAIGWPYSDVLPSAYLGGFIGRADWLKANPNTAKAFTAALQRGMDVMKDDKEARKWTVEFTKMDPAIVDKMWLSVWHTKVDLKSVQKQLDVMVDLGMLKQKTDPASLFWSSAVD